MLWDRIMTRPALLLVFFWNWSAFPQPSAEPAKSGIAMEALKRLQGIDLNANPGLKAAVYKLLDQSRGTAEFVEIVRQLRLQGQDQELLEIASAHPGTDYGVEAIRLVLGNQEGLGLIKQFLERTNTAAVQGAAEALGNAAEKKAVPILVALLKDSKQGVEFRKQVVRALARTEEGAREILGMARGGQLSADLKPTASSELNNVRWPNLQAEAAQVLPPAMIQGSESFPGSAELLKMKGDRDRGEGIFYRENPGCFHCHQIKGKGTQIGPELSEIGSKLGKDALIESILDPSAGISVGYETYDLELKSGDEAYGLLVSDSVDEVAIKDLKGIVTRYRKSEIISRRQLKTSIMPTSLQQSMSPQELMDLVEFLSSLKKP